MTSAEEKQRLHARLKPYGQQHLLHFWEELGCEEQAQLATQIDRVDLELMAALFRGQVDQHDWAALSRRAVPPPAIRLSDRTTAGGGALGIDPAAAYDRGDQALRSGHLGVLLTAGGQGSRLGFDLPKALYPIGPVSGVSLLQIHIEKVLALAQRYGAPVPLYLMTSPATHDQTVQALVENQNFGLPEDDLFVFCQGTMPAVDERTGELLLAEKHKLWLSPDGHGGTVAALGASGALQHIEKHGVRHLFYLQVDNPLVPICDPIVLGYHLLAESELTSIAVAKGQPHDKLGNFAMIDGAMHVIEYSDFPDDVAQLRDASGDLKFWAGSIAVHVFALSLLERSLEFSDRLPFHIARKLVPALAQSGPDPSGDLSGNDSSGDGIGNRVERAATAALKYERFIFDLLPTAERPIIVELAEPDCFAPLKNAPGAAKDTAAYVQGLMCAQSARWLEAAGAQLAADIHIELSPLFGLDAAGVAERVQPGRVFSESQYLGG
ncbi:MAG: UTP--glucose-1-phosphate uridylyltransferase [Pirellulales bacterium]|nr:UTP--glucose-1-phosphate uridylyltransferase [Pirellulales bacterium]